MTKNPLDRVYERLLILRCQAGDEAAFEDLVERYGARLSYFLRKLLGRTDAGEDLAQDVWFDVWRGLPRLRDADAFVAWLYRIARNHVFRQLRHPVRPAGPLDETIAAEEVDERLNPQDMARVQEAMEHLSPEHREVLILAFMEEMSCEQIAGIISCPAGTVRSRLHYAKQAMRQRIGKEIQP